MLVDKPFILLSDKINSSASTVAPMKKKVSALYNSMNLFKVGFSGL